MEPRSHQLLKQAEKIDFIGCIYLLKEEEAFASLKTSLQEKFHFSSAENQDLALPLNPHSPTYFRLKPLTSNQIAIDLHLKPLEKSLAVQLLWFSTENTQPEVSLPNLSYFDQFEDFLSRLKAKTAILGSTVLFITDANLQLKQELLAKFNLTEEMIMSTADGQLHFFAYKHQQRHFYILEASGKQKWHDPLTTDFTVMDWHFHKLQREKSYFSDRLRTINKERLTTDEQLSDVLYRKPSTQIAEAEKAAFLQEQLSKLAKMYSLTANNLHLARQAVATVRTDIQNLINASQKLGHLSQTNFPRAYLQTYESWLAQIIQQENDLKISLKNIKAAIDLVSAQIELHRGNEALQLQNQTKELLNQNITLQQEVFSLQSAAELVELVVVFYYALKSWEGVAPEKLVAELPSLLKFFPVTLFSLAVVGATHYIAEMRYHRHPKTIIKLTLMVILVIIALLFMIFLPITYKHA